MRTAIATASLPVAPPELIPGWRTLWSPVTGRIRHVVELMRERALTLAEIAEIEAQTLAADLPEVGAEWVLELLDRVALDLTCEPERLTPEDEPSAQALCELLYALRGPLGLTVDRTPWGADWIIEELALRVFIVIPTPGAAPFFEVLRL